MKRIIIHWTAGAHQPNNKEFESYHFLVNKDGIIIEGKYKPEDNENVNDGNYAQHTGGGNTGSIGISMCGMLNFDKPEGSKYPLTEKQCQATFKKCAELCKKYNIPITVDTVLTHYEFSKKHPNTTSYGKIDITWLPYAVAPGMIGDYIRNKVKWYFQKL